MAKTTYRCDGVLRETGVRIGIAVAASSDEEAIRIANEHGVLVESAKIDATVIFCPYCYTILPSDVPMVGQTVVCPRCHAQVRMPDTTGRTQQAAMGQMVYGILAALLGFLVMWQGCQFLRLANH
jgi:uncharacterized paraquat-inducible protein A